MSTDIEISRATALRTIGPVAAKIDIPEAAIEPYGRHKANLNIAATCGEIMTMPGLPRMPAAENIRLGTDGTIEGLS